MSTADYEALVALLTRIEPDLTDDQRKKLRVMFPLFYRSPFDEPENSARCLACKTVIHSKHVHDFVTCKCKDGYIFVDGGDEYLRFGGDMSKFDLSWDSGVSACLRLPKE